MIEVNIIDNNFTHTESLLGYITCSDTLKPTQIKWLNGLKEYDGITIYTDNFINSPLINEIKSDKKVFWLLEPPAINPEGYEIIKTIEDKFD
jgi:hypothetical protein